MLSSIQRDQSIPWKVSQRRYADDVLITGSHIGDQLTILLSLISNNIRKYQFLKSDGILISNGKQAQPACRRGHEGSNAQRRTVEKKPLQQPKILD